MQRTWHHSNVTYVIRSQDVDRKWILHSDKSEPDLDERLGRAVIIVW